MDARLHPLFRPIQVNGTDLRTYYIEHNPSAALTAYVACYWESGTREYDRNEAIPNRPTGIASARVLPDGCTDILITYDAVRSEHSYAYCGNYTQPFALPFPKELPPAGDYTFGVRFFPGGASFFHGLPLNLFTDRRLSLEECWPEKMEELRERIAITEHFEQRVQIMDEYLRLLSIRRNIVNVNHEMMKNVLHRIFVDGGRMSVQELAMREVVSERKLHRKFAEWIGISPKRFSEVVRFHRVLCDIQQGQSTDGVTLAQNHGFYDQAHLIRHFRKFYGETPLTAAKEHGQMLSDLYNRSAASSVILKS